MFHFHNDISNLTKTLENHQENHNLCYDIQEIVADNNFTIVDRTDDGETIIEHSSGRLAVIDAEWTEVVEK